MHSQLGLWPCADRAHDLRIPVAARNIEILIELVGTVAIHEFTVQLFVEDAADRSAHLVKSYPVEGVLHYGVMLYFRRWGRNRVGFIVLNSKAFVANRR